MKEGSDVVKTKHLSNAAYEKIDTRDGMPEAFDSDLEKLMRLSKERQRNRLANVKRSLDEVLSQ